VAYDFVLKIGPKLILDPSPNSANGWNPTRSAGISPADVEEVKKDIIGKWSDVEGLRRLN
jgi:hypothetical protein